MIGVMVEKMALVRKVSSISKLPNRGTRYGFSLLITSRDHHFKVQGTGYEEKGTGEFSRGYRWIC